MPLSKDQRARLIAEAKTWIGTPYVGHSKVKGPRGGVDCGQLLYAVYHACDLLPALTLPVDYSLQVSMHRASTEYVDLVATYFQEIPESCVLPADLVVYKLGHAYAHGGIVVEWPRFVIHAVNRLGTSGAHGTDYAPFRRAERKFFTLRERYVRSV